MTAFDHFQRATVMIAEGRLSPARQRIRAAIRWIDRTGKDQHMRGDLSALLETLTERSDQ